MLQNLRTVITSVLSHLEVQQEKEDVKTVEIKKNNSQVQDDHSSWGKVPRNAKCPCGSEKKFKHCHGKLI